METVFAHKTQEETPVSEAVQSLDVDLVLVQMNAKGREVGPTDFIRALIAMFGYTYEYARDVVYGLIEIGRASLTNNFNLRFAE